MDAVVLHQCAAPNECEALDVAVITVGIASAGNVQRLDDAV
jgi:hypothetical protein